MQRRVAQHICILVLLHAVAIARSTWPSLSTVERDMEEAQIPGVYDNIPLPGQGATDCAPKLRFAQVEPKTVGNILLFIIPHEFISIPQYGSERINCVDSGTVAGSVTSFSATVLRRSGELQLDRSVDLIDQFVLAEEKFFIGFEVGNRVCGSNVLANSTVSMWMAPSQGVIVRARAGPNLLRFTSGSKYIYYFHRSTPCLYKGDARDVGIRRKIPSPSPSNSPIPSPSTSTLPVVSPAPSPAPGGGVPGGSVTRPTERPDSVLNNGPSPRNSSNEPICFPSMATVRLRGGDRISMYMLRVGDTVHTGIHKGVRMYSQVIGFSHRDSAAMSSFVTLWSAHNLSVTLSSGHLIYTSHGMIRAEDAHIGDSLIVAESGVETRIVRKTRGMFHGLYSPQTESGIIDVDGIVCSTYTDAVEFSAAHAALLPVRASARVWFLGWWTTHLINVETFSEWVRANGLLDIMSGLSRTR